MILGLSNKKKKLVVNASLSKQSEFLRFVEYVANKMVLVKHLLLTVLSLVIAKIAGQAFDIEMSDKAGEDENTRDMLESGEILISNIKNFEADELKGFSGTIGIVGGSFEFLGATYFAGMTALKVNCAIFFFSFKRF